MPARIGIVAVHGVIPQARYGFQDQVATELTKALNLNKEAGDPGPWQMSVVFPSPAAGAKPVASTDPTDTPTIARIHLSSEANPDDPVHDFFDVHEAYWSPIDKGKTSATSVLQWLLTTIFLPINDTARYLERIDKVAWDIGFVLSAIVLGVLCFIASLLAAAWALGATQLAKPPSLLDGLNYLANPLALLKGFHASIIAALVVGSIGAYLGAQTIRAIWSLSHNLPVLLKSDPVQLASRCLAIVVLAIMALGGVAYCMFAPNATHHPLQAPGLVLVVSVLCFQSGRTLLLWFLAKFFGDVQIYTARDENSDFFALREKILNLVTSTIIGVADGSAIGQPYDRVYVLAHSLGSTIALDALMRIYNAHKAGAVLPGTWTSLRGFVTFGTALEKTKYFFNACSPTQSQAYEEWQDDLYGPLFTAEPAAILSHSTAPGIFWLNCWYYSDFVADKISSYRSYVLPGQSLASRHANRAAAQAHAKKTNQTVAGRLVAANRWTFGDFSPFRLRFVTHGDYLTDQKWFWKRSNPTELGVIDVLTSGLSWAKAHPLVAASRAAPKIQLAYEATSNPNTLRWQTRYVIKP